MDVDIFGDGADAEDDLGEEIARADTDEIAQRTRMIENEIKVLKNESARLNHEKQSNAEKIKVRPTARREKIKAAPAPDRARKCAAGAAGVGRRRAMPEPAGGLQASQPQHPHAPVPLGRTAARRRTPTRSSSTSSCRTSWRTWWS